MFSLRFFSGPVVDANAANANQDRLDPKCDQPITPPKRRGDPDPEPCRARPCASPRGVVGRRVPHLRTLLGIRSIVAH
jgi:hypothetical protein